MVESGQRCVLMFLAVLVSMLGPACASAPERGQEGPHAAAVDARIAAAVEQRLAGDDDLDAAAIRVRVAAGVVTLEGTVGSRDEARRAIRHAGRVDGVRQVINRLIVIDQAGSRARAAPPGARLSTVP